MSLFCLTPALQVSVPDCNTKLAVLLGGGAGQNFSVTRIWKKETMKYFPGSRKTWDGHKIRGGNRPSYCFFHPTIGNLNTFMSTVYLRICIVFKNTYGRKSADRTEPDFDVISCVLNILPGIHVFNQKLIVEFDQWYIPPLIFVVNFGKHRWC